MQETLHIFRNTLKIKNTEKVIDNSKIIVYYKNVEYTKNGGHMLFFEKEFSLRERKQAKMKVFLAKEFLGSLKEAKYEDVSIRSICEKAEVSEGTFYNYFSQKRDMFNYITSLYGIRKTLETNGMVSKDNPVHWLEVYFENTVKMMLEMGDLSNEILAIVIRERVKPQKTNITWLEFLYMFPEMEKEDEKDFKNSFSIEDCLDDMVEKISAKVEFKNNISNRDIAISLKLLFILFDIWPCSLF